MRITAHGNLPDSSDSPEEDRPADSHVNVPGEHSTTIDLAFFNLRTQQRSARQTSLIAQWNTPENPSASSSGLAAHHEPLATVQKSKEEYFEEWDAWGWNSASDEDRQEAVRRMKAWLDTNDPDQQLNLNGLGLTSLPENLPANLHSLDASENQLTHLPMNLPANLHTLDVNDNLLTCLPENLPANLQELYVGYNELTSLPENLPENLVTLNVSNNQLTSLPENLPANLRTLYASANPLTSLPETILTLPNTCTIHISASHLSEAVRNRLAAAMNAPGYSNALIRYDMGDQRNGQARPLQEAVFTWAQELHHTAPIDWTPFQSETHAPQFSLFLDRLRQTSEYLNLPTRSNFQQRVGNLLRQLQDNPSLRGTCFNLAHDAVETCGDRVALRMLNMETVCLDQQMETDINLGKFDRNPQALVHYCEAQYRQQALDDAASAKIKTLNFCDEIEVLLGFIVAFSREFNLNAQMNTLLYAPCSNITPEDVRETRRKLTNQPFTEESKALYRPFFEKFTQRNPAPIDRLNHLPTDQKTPSEIEQDNRSFLQFLANSPAMMSLLKRKYPEEVSSLEKNIAQAIEQEQDNIRNQLEQLTPEDPQFNQLAQSLQHQYNAVPEVVNAGMKQTLLQRLCSENGMHATLT